MPLPCGQLLTDGDAPISDALPDPCEQPGSNDPDGGGLAQPCILEEICTESYPPQCRDICLNETIPEDECPNAVTVQNGDGEEVVTCVDGAGEQPGSGGEGEEPGSEG